jgi:hypothetical protein
VTRLRAAAIVLGLAMVAWGCADWLAADMPPEARPATQLEQAQALDVAARWAERVGPIGQRCADYLARLHIIDASGRDIGSWCWACPPSEDPWTECDAKRYGRAAACAAQRDSSPIAVVWEGLTGAPYLYAIHHEMTHLLGHCERPPGHYWTTHTDPVLWGADGVHPL